MKQTVQKHPYLWGFFSASLLCLALLFICRCSVGFAEWFSTGPAAFFRFLLAAITSPLPFSLFELSIALFSLFVLFVFSLAIRALIAKIKKSAAPKHLSRCALAVVLTLVTVVDLFSLTFGPCYFRISTAQNMDLDLDAVDEPAVFFALESLCKVVNDAAPALSLNENGESTPSEDFTKIKQQVVSAADRFGNAHPFYQNRGFAAKSFLVSPLMTYTHLSGVYGFFTGEANVNTNYPHFIVTATLAHETCHARGIAPENECNFLAAVLLMESDSAYLRYCGAAFVIDDFISLCKKMDAARTSQILAETDPVLLRDFAAYNRFFEPYRNSTASKVADKTNSTYLKAMGQAEGTVSYSRIIGLTSAYFLQNTP